MGDLVGKVAVVTGGSSGIGKATAILMAGAGARVVIAARREKERNETVSIIRDAGGTAVFVQADVSVEADIKRLMDTAVETYGSLDCAFNNAGRLCRVTASVGPARCRALGCRKRSQPARALVVHEVPAGADA